MPNLPADYIQQITGLLGPETDEFIASYEKPRAYGLRFNPLKLPADPHKRAELAALFNLRQVPWCEEGRYYDPDSRPGRHPYHTAGLYYIQEPSAMIAVELLDPKPGEIILDLAAAPGGKSTQIAGKIMGEGLLIANEIHPARAKILSENIERMGIGNAVVTQAAPQELSARFAEAFDRIMLDAPCSGEGMFRKEPEAVQEWSPASVEACAARQRIILPHAAAMLKPGGRMVYSTCTFNTLENEQTVAAFLAECPEFTLLREERIWPHREFGEGHYAALLEKSSSYNDIARGRKPASQKSSTAEKAALKVFTSFAEEYIPGFRLPSAGIPLLFGDALYWLPQPAGSPLNADTMRGLRIPRAGLHLGDLLKRRFEPSHALALALKSGEALTTADYAADSPEVAAYLRGETLPAAKGIKGWGLMMVQGFPLGWFKASDGQQKNRLPKGLRNFAY